MIEKTGWKPCIHDAQERPRKQEFWPAKGARRGRAYASPAARPLGWLEMSHGAFFPSPGPPPQYSHNPPPWWFCLMDSLPFVMGIWTTLRVDHMPTLRRSAAHRGPPFGPDALRLPCAFGAFQIFRNTGDLPPTGWREGESSGQASPSPPSMCLSGLALPARPGRRSVGRFRARRAGVALLEPRSRVRPAPHPVAASSLWVALWRESAVVPTARGSQPGGVPGWGQVLRRSPPALPDVQQHTAPPVWQNRRKPARMPPLHRGV